MGDVVSRSEVHLIERYATTTPRPRCTAEGATDCDFHLRMAAWLAYHGAGSFCEFRIDVDPSRLEHCNIAAQAFEFESQCHTDGPRPDDAHVKHVVAGREMVGDHFCVRGSDGFACAKCILRLMMQLPP